MVVDAPIRSQSPRGLNRALRVVDAGPRPFYRASLASLAATSLLTIAIALVIRPAGLLPGQQRALIVGAVAGLCLAVGLGLASALLPARAGKRRLDRLVPPAERAAIWLGLAAWIPFLLVPGYLLARSTEPAVIQWNTFGFLDKRWETSAFLIGTLGPMLALVAASRVLGVGRTHPRIWRDWLRGLVAGIGGGSGAGTGTAEPDTAGSDTAGSDTAGSDTAGSDTAGSDAVPGSAWSRRGPAARIAAGLLTATCISWYFYGPPWYLNANRQYIGAQDDLWLGGLQAMSRGHLPYIGPAAVQYGPGTQLASYLYMRATGAFSVLGFRESWALFQWIGATIFLAVLFLAFGYLRGLAASLLAVLIYPTLQLLGFAPGQTYDGFFGWANPMRYAGAFALVVLLPGVVRRCGGRRGVALAAGLGVLWGVLSYAAQENLLDGALGALVIAALLFLSGTASGRAVVTALLAIAGGFALVWLPVLGFYAAHGVLGRFLWLYLLIPRAVAAGYSNTPFKDGLANPWARTFYLFPFVLAAIALLSVLRTRPLRVATGWSRQRVMLVTALVATVVIYEGALLRSDTAHLSGTMLGVPALVVVAASAPPGRLGARGYTALVLAGAALVAGAFALLPLASFQWAGVAARLEAPYLDRMRLAGAAGPRAPVTMAGRRVGAGLDAALVCCQKSTLAMPGFVRLMNRIHSLIGNRVTYVTDFPHGYPGVIYFVANLNPAPIPVEPGTMVLNSAQLRSYIADFKTEVLPVTRALVTSSLNEPETKAFLARYRSARRIRLSYLGKAYYVILA